LFHRLVASDFSCCTSRYFAEQVERNDPLHRERTKAVNTESATLRRLAAEARERDHTTAGFSQLSDRLLVRESNVD